MLRLSSAAFSVSFLIASALSISPNLAAQTMGQLHELGVGTISYSSPSIVYNPDRDEYVVVSEHLVDSVNEVSRIVACTLDRKGNITNIIQAITPYDTYARILPDVVYDPDQQVYFVVYSKDVMGDGSDWDPYAVVVDPVDLSGVLFSGEFTLGYSGYDDLAPEVAVSTTSDRFVVTWLQDHSSIHSRIRGLPVATSDYGLGTPFTIASYTSVDLESPDIVWDPTNNRFLVVYDDGSDVYGKTIDGSSLAVGSEVQIAGWSDWETEPTVATCGEGRFLAGWKSLKNGTQFDVTLRFLKADGTTDPIDFYAPFGINQTVSDHEQAVAISCAHDASEYLVVWRQGYTADNVNIGVHGGTVTTDREYSPVPLLIRTAYPGDGINVDHPAVAGARGDWLVAWDQWPQSGDTGDELWSRFVHHLFADGFESGDTSNW